MSVLNKIIQLENLFQEHILEDLFYYANSVGAWNFQNSDPQYGKKRFLIMQLQTNPIVNELVSIIKEKTNKNLFLKRVYLNGQFYGMPGAPHYDSDSENDYTFLTYINPEWDISWGGQTIFFDKSYDPKTKETITHSQDYKIFYPRRNLSLFFPAYILHYAECPTKICDELRVTLAFKFEVLL